MAKVKNYWKFGMYVKTSRLQLGFTTAESFRKTKKLSIALRYLHAIECGDRLPKVDHAISLARALDEDLNVFFRKYFSAQFPETIVDEIFSANATLPEPAIQALAVRLSTESQGHLRREILRQPHENIKLSSEAEKYLTSVEVAGQVVEYLSTNSPLTLKELKAAFGNDISLVVQKLLRFEILEVSGTQTYRLKKKNLILAPQRGREIAINSIIWKLISWRTDQNWQRLNSEIDLPAIRFACDRVRKEALPVIRVALNRLIDVFWSGTEGTTTEDPVIFMGTCLLARPEQLSHSKESFRHNFLNKEVHSQ